MREDEAKDEAKGDIKMKISDNPKPCVEERTNQEPLKTHDNFSLRTNYLFIQ